jgi:predicted secreted protein
MNPFSMFVMFLIIWWTVLFAVLPLGIRGQAEEDNVVEGSEPGAPVDSNIKGKFILTTKVAVVVWVIICAIIWSGLLDWDMFGEWLGRSPTG